MDLKRIQNSDSAPSARGIRWVRLAAADAQHSETRSRSWLSRPCLCTTTSGHIWIC